MTDQPLVAYMNESTTFTDAEIAEIMAADQEDTSANGHWWELVPAVFKQIPKGDPAPAGYRQHVFLDNADQANALGYHELTSEGLTLSKVFVLTTQNDGQTVSRVSNHERWEDFVDPWLNRYTTDWDRAYAIEPGDLCSLDSQGRSGPGGVLLSDIALPAAYFKNYGTKYSLGGTLTAGLPNVAPADGAYLMWQGGAGWEGPGTAPFIIQPPPVIAAAQMTHILAQAGSRRHRRMIPEALRRRSTVPGR